MLYVSALWDFRESCSTTYIFAKILWQYRGISSFLVPEVTGLIYFLSFYVRKQLLLLAHHALIPVRMFLTSTSPLGLQ